MQVHNIYDVVNDNFDVDDVDAYATASTSLTDKFDHETLAKFRRTLSGCIKEHVGFIKQSKKEVYDIINEAKRLCRESGHTNTSKFVNDLYSNTDINNVNFDKRYNYYKSIIDTRSMISDKFFEKHERYVNDCELNDELNEIASFLFIDAMYYYDMDKLMTVMYVFQAFLNNTPLHKIFKCVSFNEVEGYDFSISILDDNYDNVTAKEKIFIVLDSYKHNSYNLNTLLTKYSINSRGLIFILALTSFSLYIPFIKWLHRQSITGYDFTSR